MPIKDTKSALLVMLSCGLVGTWGYYIYDKAQRGAPVTMAPAPMPIDSLAISRGVADSLNKIFQDALRSLGTELDSTNTEKGLLRSELQTRMAEIYKLRLEISLILKKNNVKKEDLDLARQKTIELQMLVADLQNRNTTVEEEKIQIAGILEKVNIQVKDLETSNQQLLQENRIMSEKISQANTFIATDIHFSPVTVKADKEIETNQASKASKLVISFEVTNNIYEASNAEIFVVITNPDGHLLSDDVWESSALLDTKNAGKIRYTRKIKFDYQKGETKEISFSLNADGYQKGTYLLQLYHNGFLIGQTRKTLS